MHDPVYRRLFAFPRMVADLLRAVVDASVVNEVDLGTLEILPAEHVGDRGQQRRGDAAWRVRFRNGWLYLLILLEYQSTNDQKMALRNLEYTTLLYQELDRRGELGKVGQWPPVLPVVLYNGEAPWTATLQVRDLIAPVPPELKPYQPSQQSALLDERRIAAEDLPVGNLMRAVVGIEQSQTPIEVGRVADALRGLLGSADTELARAFVAWIKEIVGRIDPTAAGLDLGDTLEETTMTIADRAAQWPARWRREGEAQGRREGVVQGRREGVVQGLREALANQHASLRRVAAARFGPAAGERVEGRLVGVEDWDRLTDAVVVVATAGSETELMERLEALLR